MSTYPQITGHPQPGLSTAATENPINSAPTAIDRWKAERFRRDVAENLISSPLLVKGSPVRPETVQALLHRWIPSRLQFENVEAFASRVKKQPPGMITVDGQPFGLVGGCWNFWTRERLYAYPSFRDRVTGRWHSAYLWLFEQLHGPLTADFPCVDHRCENKRCVNPDHLQAVTQSENVLASKRRAAERERERLAEVLSRSPSMACVRGQGTR